MYDVIIVGMGIGGITAGIYAKRANLNVLLLDKSAPGGLLNNIDLISNYPGFIDIKGPDLALKLFEQVKSIEIPYKLEEVIKIKVNEDIKEVITNSNTYQTKNIIIATGTHPKYLGLDNEKELLGKGLSTCALCDGTFYKDKVIAVVGNGNSALQESLYLAKLAKKVYLLNRKGSFKGEEYLQDKVKNKENIEIKYNVSITKYNQVNNKIESILLSNNEKIKVSGVFIYVGYKANSELVNGLDIINADGRIMVDNNCETKIKGLYAVGDVNDKGIYQLITASNDGVIAIANITKKI